MSTEEIIVDIQDDNPDTMTINRNGMITSYESFYMDIGYAKLLTATDAAKDYFGPQIIDTYLDSFVTQSFNGTVNIDEAKNVKSSIATIAQHINANKPDPIIIPIVSKTSTSLGLIGTQVISGYVEQFYDSGPKKVFIPPEPKIVGTIGGHIDPLSKGFTNKSWPPIGTTIKFTQRYCERVGLPEGFSMETITKNSTDSTVNSANGNPVSGTLTASITISYRFGVNSKKVIQTFGPLNSGDTTGDTSDELVSKYTVGNKKKNIIINDSKTSAEDRFLYFLYKELGDFVQVLIYTIACHCNAITKLLYILLTTDYIVYLRLRAFLQHVLYTGVRAGVKSGQAIYWHNFPELLSFPAIKQRLKTYNESLYYDILHHNIANLNYLCKIRFGLNKLKKLKKTIEEKKAHNKQAKRILHIFSLWVPNKRLRGKFPSMYKKIYLSRIASGCNYYTPNESNDTNDENNDEILNTIIGNINILINEIINKIIELIIFYKYYSKLLENCDSGTINLPCLVVRVAETIKLRHDLIEELRKIFTDIEDIESITFETLLDKIDGKLAIVEIIDKEYDSLASTESVASTESAASRASIPSIPSADGQSIEAILINNCPGAMPSYGGAHPDDDSMGVDASSFLPLLPVAAPDDFAMSDLGSSSASAGQLPTGPSPPGPSPPGPSPPGPSPPGQLPPSPSSGGLDTDLPMQIKGINNLIKKIASLKDNYQSTTYFSIISTSQVIIINPKFLINEYEYEYEYEYESNIIPYTIGARGTDIIDNELESVYAMLELELEAEKISPAKGGSGSQVTKKHLKINIQGKNNNRKNVTKKYRKMIKSRNKVMTGGVKRRGVNLGSVLLQRPKDDVPDYIRIMSKEEEDEDNNLLNYLMRATPNSLITDRMNVEHVKTSNMSQEDFIWYVAEQIVSKFDPINNYKPQEMTTLVYDIIVNKNIEFEELLATFFIPYNVNNSIINKANISESENFMSICETLPKEIPEAEAEAVMGEVEAEAVEYAGMSEIGQPFSSPVVPLLQKTVSSASAASSAASSVLSDEAVEEAGMSDVGQPFSSPVVPLLQKTVSAASDSSALSGAPSNKSMELGGGYSGINKKKNKSRKNKKTRRKTRRNTRRKSKKIKTRKNKQIRRKH